MRDRLSSKNRIMYRSDSPFNMDNPIYQQKHPYYGHGRRYYGHSAITDDVNTNKNEDVKPADSTINTTEESEQTEAPLNLNYLDSIDEIKSRRS